jgi:hypothetical protein
LKAEGYEVPQDAIKEALAELFDSVAIHVWHRGDVYHVAREAGWPISQTMADEILSDVEGHVDPEYGITWLTFNIAVQEFYGNFDWSKQGLDEQRCCIGSFLICLDPPDSAQAAETLLYLGRTSLAEALEEAAKMAEKSRLTITCYSIPKGEEPSLDAEWLEQNAHKLWSFEPEAG